MTHRVLDLFSGMGGLSLGFAKVGFKVVGVDISRHAVRTYTHNSVGKAHRMDLSRSLFPENGFSVVIGGPPCRPWSSVNLRRRGRSHPDSLLLTRFFANVARIRPAVFLMENVPPLKKDPIFLRGLDGMRRLGYSVAWEVVRYSDFGAATSRRRLIVVGLRVDSVSDENAGTFFERLGEFRESPMTVEDALRQLSENDPDHVWPKLRTIHRYSRYYETGKFGWYRLERDRPAPSFGNVTKTYILHPDSRPGGEARVISVKEAMLIMGFPPDFSFPKGIPMGSRYQMVADAVSPKFSLAAAKVIREMLR